MEKYCLNCGKLLTEKQVKEKGKFCSHSCSASYNNKIRTRKSKEKTYLKVLNIIDKISDKDFIDIIQNSSTMKEIHNKLGYKKTSLCTKVLIQRRCESLGIDLQVKDKVIPANLTKKELFEGRSSWQSARTEFRKQAAKNFEESGKEKKCAICGYDKHIDIAHINAVSEFSEDTLVSEISKASNLIALCPNHHWEYDHGLLDITPYI